MILFSIFSSGAVSAEFESRLRDGGAPLGIRLAGTEDAATETKVYIVQLATPSAAEFHARSQTGFSGKPAFGGTTTARRFDKNSAAIQGHVSRLATEQASVLSKLGGDIQPLYSYRYTLNGFAATMSAAQANKMEHMTEVLHVWEDEVRPLSTSSSASFLGLFEPDVGLRGAPGLDGEGVVIGVIDSGIAPEHPALQDTREADRPQACRSAWGEGTLLGGGCAIVSNRWKMCRYLRRRKTGTVFAKPVRSSPSRIATTR